MNMKSDFNSIECFMCYRPSKFAFARSLRTQAQNHLKYIYFFGWCNWSTGKHQLCLISSQSFIFFTAWEQFSPATCKQLYGNSKVRRYISTLFGYFHPIKLFSFIKASKAWADLPDKSSTTNSLAAACTIRFFSRRYHRHLVKRCRTSTQVDFLLHTLIP